MRGQSPGLRLVNCIEIHSYIGRKRKCQLANVIRNQSLSQDFPLNLSGNFAFSESNRGSV